MTRATRARSVAMVVVESSSGGQALMDSEGQAHTGTRAHTRTRAAGWWMGESKEAGTEGGVCRYVCIVEGQGQQLVEWPCVGLFGRAAGRHTSRQCKGGEG